MKLRHVSIAASIMMFMSGASAIPLPYKLIPFHAPASGSDVVADAVGAEYFISRDELRFIPRLKMALISDIAGRPGIVRLSDVGSVKLDDLQGELNLQVRIDLLEPQIVGGHGMTGKIQLPDQPAMNAVMGDYDIRAETLSGKTNFGFFGSASSWFMGNRIDAAMVTGSRVDSQLTHLRISREDLTISSLIEGGTIYASSGSRTSPGQILGVGIRHDRGIAPGFITGPNLRVNGVAGVQSTVDVLVDNQRVQHTVQPGPFTVVADPTTNGGVASVVVRDDLGQERVVSAQLWANPSLLGVGQVEYALSAGKLSQGGLNAEGLAAAGYFRQGVTTWLTSEVGFEATEGLTRMTVASDVATVIGDFSIDYAAGNGRSSSVRYALPSLKINEWSISGGAQFSSMSIDYMFSNGMLAGKDRSFQRGINASGTTKDWSISGTYAETPAGQFASASLGHALSNSGASLSITAMRFDSASTKTSNSLFLSLSIPLGGKFLSVSASDTMSGLRKSAAYGGRVTDDISASFNMSGVNSVELIGADAAFQVGAASASIGVAKPTGQDASYRGSLRGGFIAHGKGIVGSGSSTGDGGFAVVDLGVPGVDVYSGFGTKTTTNDQGVAVLRLPSLYSSRISIDASSAPDNLDLSSIDTSVNRRGGVKIERKPVTTNGRFIQIEGAVPGETLTVEGERLPITDRGVWVDLEKGEHLAAIGSRKLSFSIK